MYVDDSIWALQGLLRRRSQILAFIIYTMELKLSMGKGLRAPLKSWETFSRAGLVVNGQIQA